MKASIPFPIVVLLAMLLLLTATSVSAEGGYALGGSVVSGGGGTLQSGAYTLSGTLGQAEAAHRYSGGSYQITGGFWHPAVPGPQPETRDKIYLPLTLRQ